MKECSCFLFVSIICHIRCLFNLKITTLGERTRSQLNRLIKRNLRNNICSRHLNKWINARAAHRV